GPSMRVDSASESDGGALASSASTAAAPSQHDSVQRCRRVSSVITSTTITSADPSGSATTEIGSPSPGTGGEASDNEMPVGNVRAGATHESGGAGSAGRNASGSGAGATSTSSP